MCPFVGAITALESRTELIHVHCTSARSIPATAAIATVLFSNLGNALA
jgi:hypothetical protein